MTPRIAIKGAKRLTLMNSIIFLAFGIAKTMPAHNRQRRAIHRIVTSSTLDMNEHILDKISLTICKSQHACYKNKWWGFKGLLSGAVLFSEDGDAFSLHTPFLLLQLSHFTQFLRTTLEFFMLWKILFSISLLVLFTDRLCHLLDVNYVPNATLRTMTSNKGAKLTVYVPVMLKKFSSGHCRVRFKWFIKNKQNPKLVWLSG